MRADDERHGTTAGYAAHLRRGERPCGPCRDAKNAYNRALVNGEDEDQIALTGGHWVTVRGVLRWQDGEVVA